MGSKEVRRPATVGACSAGVFDVCQDINCQKGGQVERRTFKIAEHIQQRSPRLNFKALKGRAAELPPFGQWEFEI